MAHSLDDKKTRTKDVILDENVTFDSLFLQQSVLKGLTDSGYRKPSPIQKRAIPIGRCGFDLIVKSKSGTGKTLVFAVIALESLNLEKCAPQVLILVPAREIAVQIQAVLKSVGRYCEGLGVESFIGGLPVKIDKEKCQTCHIAVGTPGRIKQLIKEKHLKPCSVSLFILDEADKLMESSFQNDINEIYNALPNKKQLIMTSATFTNELRTFLGNYMLSPTEVTVEIDSPLLLGLKHFVSVVKCHPNVVQQTKIKNEELLKILSNIRFTQCLVFSNYQTRAESLSNMLKQNDWNATFITAAQSQKQRLEAINDLQEFKCRILLSTDLTSRGIDASNVDLVINYDIPFEAVTYLHRMGRAGRYGSTGICINLASSGTELKLLQTILGIIGGTNISIPKLPELTPELDLYSIVNFDSDQLVLGILSEESSDSEKIKNELLKLKAQTKEGTSKQEKNIKTKEASLKNNVDISSSKCDENLGSSIKDDDTVSLLKSLAAGNLMNCSSFDKTFLNEENMQKEQLKDVDTERILESMAFGALSGDPINSVTKSEALQKRMPSGDDKKRKRSLVLESYSSKPDLEDCKKQNSPNDLCCKNLAMFNVAKIVSNCGDIKSSAGSLETYLEVLRNEEKSSTIDCTQESKDILQNLLSCESNPKSDLKNDENNVCENDYLNNIFLKTYKSFIDSDDKNWKSHVPEDELKQFERKLLNPDLPEGDECDEEDCEDYYEEDYDMQEESEYVPHQKAKDNGQNESSDMDSGPHYEFMKWIPVENTGTKTSEVQTLHQEACMQNADEVLERYENFQDYYEQCSHNLWQTGLSFENVTDFDDWFQYEWQTQVSAIRNYVQRNVYVQEMTKFQNQVKQKKNHTK